MIALIRKLLKFINKEQRIFSRYERSHPHFFWYLGIDALLSTVLVFTGFLFFASDSFVGQKLTHAGVVGMAPSEFVDHVKHEAVVAYWLGPKSGYENTINHEVAGIADVFYWPSGTDSSDKKAFLYEVKTYKSQKVWDAHTHTILASVETETIMVSKNLSIRINPKSMKGVIATYSDRPEIVAMAYPEPQSLAAMIKNVESLKLVR